MDFTILAVVLLIGVGVPIRNKLIRKYRDRELDTYSDIGNYFRADIDKRLDKCRDFLFVIYISISIVYCILHCGGSDYFDDYYFRFLQFTKNSVG